MLYWSKIKSMPRQLLIMILSVPISLTAISQAAPLPAELNAFIVPGHEVLDFKTGDINQDKKPDAILILKNPLEDSTREEFFPRPMLILVRQADGRLKQILRNEKAVMGRHDGGVFGDPWQGLDCFDGGFSISFYGGSSWRWAYLYEFRWNGIKKKWLLTKEESSSFNAGDMEGTMKNIEITATELGEIPFEKFAFDGQYQQTKWKVRAIKTYFYDNPKLGSQPRKGYLVKGNLTSGIRQLKNFVEISFDNGREVTTGFVLKKDLVQVK